MANTSSFGRNPHAEQLGHIGDKRRLCSPLQSSAGEMLVVNEAVQQGGTHRSERPFAPVSWSRLTAPLLAVHGCQQTRVVLRLP